MAFRDRTGLFLSYRGSFSRPFTGNRTHIFEQNESTTPLLSNQSLRTHKHLTSPVQKDAIIEMDTFPPSWSDSRGEVDRVFKKIDHLSNQLEKLYAKHVLPGFDFESKRLEEREIEQLTMEITLLFRECNTIIERINPEIKIGVEHDLAVNAQVAIAKSVQEKNIKFRRKQSAYLRKLRGYSINVITGNTSSDIASDDNLGLSDDADVSFSRQTLIREQEDDQNDISVREREVQNIAKGIVELSEIFNDLQVLVIDQGTMLDRIDFNLENTAIHLKQADKQLNKASAYQRNTRKRLLILLLILLIVAVIVAIIYKPRDRQPSL